MTALVDDEDLEKYNGLILIGSVLSEHASKMAEIETLFFSVNTGTHWQLIVLDFENSTSDGAPLHALSAVTVFDAMGSSVLGTIVISENFFSCGEARGNVEYGPFIPREAPRQLFRARILSDLGCVNVESVDGAHCWTSTAKRVIEPRALVTVEESVQQDATECGPWIVFAMHVCLLKKDFHARRKALKAFAPLLNARGHPARKMIKEMLLGNIPTLGDIPQA